MNVKFLKSELQKSILLCFIGVVFGIIGNQLFYVSNIKKQARIDFEKEIIQKQYEELNQIANLFSTNYLTVIKCIDQNKEYHLPRFVADTLYKKMWLSEFVEIKKNKNKIDFITYRSITKLDDFIKKNPLPNLNQDNLFKITNSSWSNPSTVKEWDKLVENIYSRVGPLIYLESS